MVDAYGCTPDALRRADVLTALFDAVIADLDLHPAAPVLWHHFPGPGFGITGMALLMESHLTIHTFPETGLATMNLYCCRPRREWTWRDALGERLGAQSVTIRTLPRGGAA